MVLALFQDRVRPVAEYTNRTFQTHAITEKFSLRIGKIDQSYITARVIQMESLILKLIFSLHFDG